MRSVSSKNTDASSQSHKAMLGASIRWLGMARWSAAGLAMAAAAGCLVGEITGGGVGLPPEGLSPEQQTARMKWTSDALPVLRANCGSCHAGARPMIGFLAGNDDLAIRDRVMTYDPPVVNLDAATSSRLLTKSVHEGPGFTPSQATSVLDWLAAEVQAASADPNHPAPQLATPATTVSLCTSGVPDSPTCPTNHVSLAAVPGVGSSIPATELAFTAYGLTDTLYLTNFKVHGGTAGAYLEHLLVVSVPMDRTRPPIPDPIDRYFAMKLDVKANDIAQIEGGTAAFGGFSSTDQLAFHFKALTPFKPDSGGPMTQTGCKVLAKFKTDAVTPLTMPQTLNGGGTSSCVSCHAGGNPGAKGAMDLTQVTATSDAMVQLACNEVRTRLNLTTTDQSAIYLAPDPAKATTHPIKLTAAAFASFKTSLDVWARAEQTAPQGAR